MKKFFKTILVIFLCLASISPMNSTAVDGEEFLLNDIFLAENEMQQILDLNPNNDDSTKATGLILGYNIAVAKDGTKMNLVAKIICNTDVVKCGFKKIVIQRRATTSSSWSDRLVLEDFYSDNTSHIISKVISISTGYQYRAVCTFYAKKSLLVTQKIEHASNVVTF